MKVGKYYPLNSLNQLPPGAVIKSASKEWFVTGYNYFKFPRIFVDKEGGKSLSIVTKTLRFKVMYLPENKTSKKKVKK